MHFAICIKRNASHPIFRSCVLADAIIVNKLCKHIYKKSYTPINRNAHSQKLLAKNTQVCKNTKHVLILFYNV